MEVRRVEGRQRAAKLGEAYRHKAHLGHRSLPLLMSLRWKLLQASGCAEVGSLVSPTLVRCNIQRPSQARCSSASEPILSYPPEQKIRCLESRCYNFTAVWFWQWSSHKEITRKHRNHFTLIREPWRDLCQVLWSLKLQWWFVLGGWFHVTGISVPNRFWNWIKYFYWYSCIADMWRDTFRFISDIFSVYGDPEENFAAHNSLFLCLIRNKPSSYLRITEFRPVSPETPFGEKNKPI